MFRKLVTGQLKPVSGIYKVKKWIQDHGLKWTAVTNAPRPNAELMISILRLLDFFCAHIIGSECQHAKPFADPYSNALEALNVSNDHTSLFEDSVSGINAGAVTRILVIGIITRNPENLLMEAKPALLSKDYDHPISPDVVEVSDEVAEKLGFVKISEEFIGECKSKALLFKHKKIVAEFMSI